MKKRRILFFASYCFVVNLILAQSVDNLNILSYNLRFGELASMEDIARFIHNENPDIVALQECDWKTQRERAPKQNGVAFINELAYHTEMFGLYGKAIDYCEGYYGVGILSKYPIVRSERILLPNPEPTKEQRVLLIADIELPENQIITFACTHLEVSSATQRVHQIEFINEILKKCQNPVIIAGDMNAEPTAKEIVCGFSDWSNVSNEEYTFSSTNPSVKIDYIYTYPKNQMKLMATKVHTDIKLSDHFPVSATISIK